MQSARRACANKLHVMRTRTSATSTQLVYCLSTYMVWVLVENTPAVKNEHARAVNRSYFPMAYLNDKYIGRQAIGKKSNVKTRKITMNTIIGQSHSNRDLEKKNRVFHPTAPTARLYGRPARCNNCDAHEPGKLQAPRLRALSSLL